MSAFRYAVSAHILFGAVTRKNVVLSGCSSHNILLPKKSQHCSNKVRMSPSLYM